MPAGYKNKVDTYGEAPFGYRFLKEGEKFNEETDFCLLWGRQWGTVAAWEINRDGRVAYNNHLCITPSKRDSRGRFVGTKPLPEVGAEVLKWLREQNSITFLNGEVAAIKSAVADPINNSNGVFGLYWCATPQGSAYWQSRYSGQTHISADDILYLKASIAAYENRIAELRGKVKPPAPKKESAPVAAKAPALVPNPSKVEDVSGVRITGGASGDYALRIGFIDEVLAGNMGRLWSAFSWDSTRQGRAYWDFRVNDGKPLNEDDILYLKAVRAEFQSRAEKSQPTVADLKAKISSLEAENAALKAKIAGAKVTFPS